MRRAVPAVVLTIIALIALATFKSTAPGGLKSAAAHVTPTAPASTAPPPAGSQPTTPTTPTTPRPSSPATSAAARTIVGDPFDNRYGTVQVRITVQAGRITAVDPLQMPYDRSRSQYISEQAAPYLHDEVLQAQSARIDIVSGATYTSESYMQSLQSALDKAHL
jgi:uncharacterized protein with FMN-binding domain